MYLFTVNKKTKSHITHKSVKICLIHFNCESYYSPPTRNQGQCKTGLQEPDMSEEQELLLRRFVQKTLTGNTLVIGTKWTKSGKQKRKETTCESEITKESER